jgi:hypothetical protein
MQKTPKKKQYNDVLIVFQFSLLELQLRRNSCSDNKESKGIDGKKRRESERWIEKRQKGKRLRQTKSGSMRIAC